jgi:hypothetical protein
MAMSHGIDVASATRALLDDSDLLLRIMDYRCNRCSRRRRPTWAPNDTSQWNIGAFGP